MLEKEKERGRQIARMEPPERGKLTARMMFGESAEQAQMAMFMLMGSWGIAPPGPPGEPQRPPGTPPHGSHEPA